MTLFANEKEYGGNLKTRVASNIKDSSKIIIATGYISSDIIKDFTPSILRVVRQNGSFNLIVGMAFFAGIAKSNYDALVLLHEKIKSIDSENSGVKLMWKRKYHGKIYYFNKDNIESVYLGSSNFSRAGLTDNLESTVLLRDESTIEETKLFLQWLNSIDQSTFIDRISDLPINDKKIIKDQLENERIKPSEARLFDISTINLNGISFFDIPLNRVDEQPKSNLNTYFGKGRLNRNTGEVIMRNWYEVEIIADSGTINNPLYPKGFFRVITDDGYEIECKTQGDNYKNLRSIGQLSILGKWIKMKLQNSGVLIPLTLIEQEHLDNFGTRFIRMYKIGLDIYYMEFKPDDERYRPE